MAKKSQIYRQKKRESSCRTCCKAQSVKRQAKDQSLSQESASKLSMSCPSFRAPLHPFDSAPAAWSRDGRVVCIANSTSHASPSAKWRWRASSPASRRPVGSDAVRNLANPSKRASKAAEDTEVIRHHGSRLENCFTLSPIRDPSHRHSIEDRSETQPQAGFFSFRQFCFLDCQLSP